MPQTKSIARKKAGRFRGERRPETAAVIAEATRTSEDERYRMIAKRAYRNAKERRFRNGSPREDWLAAENEVDALLAGRPDD